MQAEDDVEVSRSSGNEGSQCCRSAIDKKSMGISSKRILKDHDLDQFIVYEKRGVRKTKDYYEELAQRE